MLHSETHAARLIKSQPYCEFCFISIHVAASEKLCCAALVFAVFESVSFWKHTGVSQNAVCGFTVCLSAVGMLVFVYLSLVLRLSLSPLLILRRADLSNIFRH